jgi:hypothetical protein
MPYYNKVLSHFMLGSIPEGPRLIEDKFYHMNKCSHDADNGWWEFLFGASGSVID